jgi:hypothetical protein
MLMDKVYVDVKSKTFMVWHNHLYHENRFVAARLHSFPLSIASATQPPK